MSNLRFLVAELSRTKTLQYKRGSPVVTCNHSVQGTTTQQLHTDLKFKRTTGSIIRTI